MGGMTKEAWEERKKYEIEQYGSAERAAAVRRKKMQELGSKGGKASTGYKFAHGKIDPAEAGAKSSNASWWKTELERRKGGAEQ